MKNWLIAWKDAAPAGGVLVALLSASVALLVLWYTRAANRRRATLDMVMKTLMDKEVQERSKKFKELLRKDQDSQDPFKLVSLLEKDALGGEDRREMLHQLNIYELMALGIRRGVFDEAFYKRYYHHQFLQDFEGSLEFIRGLQSHKSTIFCECSWLHKKWLKDGHPEATPNRFKMAWWALWKKNEKIDHARSQANAR